MHIHSVNLKSLPHIGYRIIKTAIAVYFCLIIYRLLGYQGEDMPTEAIITAIICMQPFIKGSREFAINRFTGTIIGSVWGLLFLLFFMEFPFLENYFLFLYALMALGVLISVYTAVVLKVPEVSGLAAIVFICIVAKFPEIEEPYLEAFKRLMGVMIGTATAITVNIAHLPRRKRNDLVFFVHARALNPNRFAKASPYVLFYMNRLYEEGAKICLILEHAPALFTMQMSSIHLNLPLIVMDGAALFDTEKNRYLRVQNILADDVLWLQSWFRKMDYSYFTYIVRHNRVCIFHEGNMHESEHKVLKQLQRSPYRSYLEEEDFHPDEVVYFKLIAEHQTLLKMQETLTPLIENKNLRCIIRDQVSLPEIKALYIFSSKATPQLAQERLMEMLHINDPDLKDVPISPDKVYHSEHDAIVLLHRLKKAYEPLAWSPFNKRKSDI